LSFSEAGKRLSYHLPRIGLSALIVSLASGLILAFYYRPMGDVFRNVEEITSLVPYGWFLRQLHYVAGQAFVILMLIHTGDHFLKKRYRTYAATQWILLILSLCLCFFVLFTGFILKGDKEGLFAGQIMLNLLQAIPLVGRRLARLFIVSGPDFYFLPYLYHCFFLPFLIVYLIRFHIREWLPDRVTFYLTFLGLFLYALWVDLHRDIPPGAMVEHVSGPWFFLGIQSLLKVLPPLTAGVVIPGAYAGLIMAAPATGPAMGKIIHLLIAGLFCLYVALTLKAIVWGI